MRKKIILSLLATILFIALTTITFAANVTITFEGERKIEPGKTGKVIVKMTADEDCGNISGKLKGENGITIKSISGKNNWNVMAYNEETGEFKLLKPAGAKTEEVMEIEYQAGNEEQTGKIEIEDTKVTTLEYELVELGSKSVEIEIKQESEEPDPAEEKTIVKIKIDTPPTKKEYTEGEKFNASGMKVVLVYSDGTEEETTEYNIANGDELEAGQKQVLIYYTDGDRELEAIQTIKVTEKESIPEDGVPEKPEEKDDTVADRSNPDAGTEELMLPVGILMIITGVAFILYEKNKNI